ncbi:MAG: hypothetical protein HYR73_02015, partial [Candidatus Eisenbacteria bacterium]|nr:hypothetical protein [Candidatus Eisenbacteria bacterium]
LRAHPAGLAGVGALPLALSFAGPRPNPITSLAQFAFDLPREARVSLAIYDLSGRRVADLATGRYSPGRHEASWNATDARGNRANAGLYFARFATAGLSRTVRVALLP